MVVQGVYKLEPNLPRFYGRSGQINEQVLEQYNIPPNLSILGYLKYRRADTHQLSLRDKAVAFNLKTYLERKLARQSPASSNPFAPRNEPSPVCMALLTSKTNENRSTHDYNYTFWSIGGDESSFKALPVDISNMIESPQEDYQSFQSNLASGVSRHSASIGMNTTIRAVPTTILVDGHEAMFRESHEATKSLAKSVLVSEKAVKDAMREIEMLKEQLENAKVAALKQSQRLKQDNDAGAENRSERTHHQRQHHHHHHHAQHTRPRVQASHSFASGAGSPPDLLY
ncbi:hypothetical protein BGX34_005708 [Mortierella sp. NVP85]|nr:hypothetical protein BGX34_005708 [Mortierella sp. NVP85]